MKFKGKEANVGRHCYADNVTDLDTKMQRGIKAKSEKVAKQLGSEATKFF